MEDLLNGVELNKKLGLLFENAVTQLLQMPTAKDSVTVDLQDFNGIKKDLADPHFAAREFNFECVQSGTSISDLQTKFRQAFTLLRKSGTQQYYNAFLNTITYIYYKKQTVKTGIYKNSIGGYSMRYTLTFGELDFEQNLPMVFLVDDLNRVLIP